MEEDKEVPLWIGIVGLILIIVCIILDCNELKSVLEQGEIVIAPVDYIVTMLTLMFAALYFMLGFKKDAALYFKLFAWTFAAGMGVFVIMHRSSPVTFSIFGLISFGICCIMAIGKDLGKKKSMVVTILGIVVSIASSGLYIYQFGTGPIGSMVSKLLMAILLFVMVNAKYADKESRGAK